MKKICLILLLSAMTWAASARDYTFGTYNIRILKEETVEEYKWENRKAAVAQSIIARDMDICAVQEMADQTQEDDMCNLLSNYSLYSWGRESASEKSGERVGIFYRPDRVQIVEKGKYFANVEPEYAEKSWGTNKVRLTIWAKFKDLSSGEQFYFFATHKDNRSHRARTESCRQDIDIINQIAYGYPVIIAGDYNSEDYHHSPAYTQLYDARKISQTPIQGAPHSRYYFCYPAYITPETYGIDLDYIFVRHWDVLGYENMVETYFGRTMSASDHLCVCSRMRISNESLQHSVHRHVTSDAEMRQVLATVYKGDSIWVDANLCPAESYIVRNSVAIMGNHSVIDGSHVSRVFLAKDSVCVTCKDLTIKNVNSAEPGAVIYSKDGVVLTNCNFINCHTSSLGGVVYTGGMSHIDNCVFDNCSAAEGGAVYMDRYMPLQVQRSLFNACSATTGAAIATKGVSGCWISQCRFHNNVSTYGTAYLNVDSCCTAQVVNSLFTGNSSSYGSALFLSPLSAANVAFCTIHSNEGLNVYLERGTTGVRSCYVPVENWCVAAPGAVMNEQNNTFDSNSTRYAAVKDERVESTAGVDMDDDGRLRSVVAVDCYGTPRPTTGKACRGAVEGASRGERLDGLKVLVLGASVTQNVVVEDLKNIFEGMGDDYTIGFASYDHSLQYLAETVLANPSDKGSFTYRKVHNNIHITDTEDASTLLGIIQQEPWDYIIFQPGKENNSYDVDAHKSYLTTVLSGIRGLSTNSKVVVGYMSLWNKNGRSDYSSLVECQQSFSEAKYMLIPAATAVQNLLTEASVSSVYKASDRVLNPLGEHAVASLLYRALTNRLYNTDVRTLCHPHSLTTPKAELAMQAGFAAFHTSNAVTSVKDASASTISWSKLVDHQSETKTGYAVDGFTLVASGHKKTNDDTGLAIARDHGTEDGLLQNDCWVRIPLPRYAKSKISVSLQSYGTGSNRKYTCYYLVIPRGQLPTGNERGVSYVEAWSAPSDGTNKSASFTIDNYNVLEDMDLYLYHYATTNSTLRYLSIANQVTVNSTRLKTDYSCGLDQVIVDGALATWHPGEGQAVYTSSVLKGSKDIIMQPWSNSTDSVFFSGYGLARQPASKSFRVSDVPVSGNETATILVKASSNSGKKARLIIDAYEQLSGGTFSPSASNLDLMQQGQLTCSIANRNCYLYLHTPTTPVAETDGVTISPANIKYGNNYFRLTVPSGGKGWLRFKAEAKGAADICCLVTDCDANLPATTADQIGARYGANVPTSLADISDVKRIVSLAESETATRAICIDLSATTKDQYVYLFHTGADVKYQTIRWYTNYTLPGPTDLGGMHSNENAKQEVKKVIKDGQLLIIRNNRIYTVQGEEVEIH